MYAGGLSDCVVGDREASDDSVGILGAVGSFRVVPHIEVKGQDFVHPVSTRHGRRENNLEGGNSLPQGQFPERDAAMGHY